MSWIARFGNRPHNPITSDELFSFVALAQRLNRHCMACENEVAGILQCKDCGTIWRFCDNHRPDSDIVKSIKKLHPVLCKPVLGDN